MILTIDIGNTTVTLGGLGGEKEDFPVFFTAKLETEAMAQAEDYRRGILARLEGAGHTPEEFSGVCISSVVPNVMEAIRGAVVAIWHREPYVITCESDLGISLDVTAPNRVGRDRLVDSAWAAAHYPLPVVTADLGTATTFNVINQSGTFCGGVIAAGMETQLKALGSRTAQLPTIELRSPSHIIGKNTEECMLSGAVVGTAAMLDGVVLGIEQELGSPVTFVITGGGAAFVHPYLRHSYIWEEQMMLKGLAYLYHRNAQK